MIFSKYCKTSLHTITPLILANAFASDDIFKDQPAHDSIKIIIISTESFSPPEKTAKEQEEAKDEPILAIEEGPSISTI